MTQSPPFCLGQKKTKLNLLSVSGRQKTPRRSKPRKENIAKTAPPGSLLLYKRGPHRKSSVATLKGAWALEQPQASSVHPTQGLFKGAKQTYQPACRATRGAQRASGAGHETPRFTGPFPLFIQHYTHVHMHDTIRLRRFRSPKPPSTADPPDAYRVATHPTL